MSASAASGPRPLRVLVVDDEPLARRRLRDLIAKEAATTIVGEASEGDGAIGAIRGLRPDLVFLDVQMPGKTGLEVVREVGPSQMPATIFVTAYDRHALAAFDLAAVDYLVKPFDDERFEQAFRRARRRLELEEVDRLSGQLLAVLQHAQPAGAPSGTRGSSYLDRIAVDERGQLRVVPVSEVDYIAASGPYVEIHSGDRTHLARERLQTLAERLDPARFVRTHRSIIVRIDLIESLLRAPGGDYAVRLKTGARLRVSRSRVAEVEARLGRLA